MTQNQTPTSPSSETQKGPREIETFANELFEHGLEVYDRDTKISSNLGGAKIFWHPAWKNPNSPMNNIEITNPDLKNALWNLPILVGSLSRVSLDENGNPISLPGREGTHQRQNSGLILYPQMDSELRSGVNLRNRINEALRAYDVKNYIEVAQLIPGDKIKVLAEQEYRNFLGKIAKLKLHAAVICAIPSGPNGLWQSKTKPGASASRAPANASADRDFPI